MQLSRSSRGYQRNTDHWAQITHFTALFDACQDFVSGVSLVFVQHDKNTLTY